MSYSDDRILSLSKFSLQISSNAYDEFLTVLIEFAKEAIKTEGIDLMESEQDDMLVVMYTDFLWRQRKENQKEMPRPLRYALNNRLFSQKARDADGYTD